MTAGLRYYKYLYNMEASLLLALWMVDHVSITIPPPTTSAGSVDAVHPETQME